MSTVVETVLDKSYLHLDGAILKVFPLVEKKKTKNYLQRLEGFQRKSGKQEESDKGKRKPNMWDERTIVVVGFKPDATGDAILMLFETKLPDDEVAILRMQRHPNRDVIYITFETANG